MRLVLEGIPAWNLELGDALEQGLLKRPVSEKYDIILANPPWDYQGLANKDPFLTPYERFRFRGEDSATISSST